MFGKQRNEKQIEILKAENKELRELVALLNSRDEKYRAFIESIGGQIETKEELFIDGPVPMFVNGPLDENTPVFARTYETITIPPFRIGYKGSYQRIMMRIRQLISI